MEALVATFNQEKALLGAFYVIMNLRMDVFEALLIYGLQGFNVDIQAHMKDSLDKQDKTKAVDIFQVMADAIQKEFAQIFLWSLNFGILQHLFSAI